VSALYKYKSLAEQTEEFMAGRTGAPCPFCGQRTTRLIVEQDRQGIIGASWACESCDETGPCRATGELEWVAP
jgi:hypothetical protein